jgi:hypothetical protein
MNVLFPYVVPHDPTIFKNCAANKELDHQRSGGISQEGVQAFQIQVYLLQRFARIKW